MQLLHDIEENSSKYFPAGLVMFSKSETKDLGRVVLFFKTVVSRQPKKRQISDVRVHSRFTLSRSGTRKNEQFLSCKVQADQCHQPECQTRPNGQCMHSIL